MLYCKICNKELSKNQRKYCSRKCNDRAYYLRHTKKLICNARKWEKANPQKSKEIKKKAFKKFYNEKREQFNKLMCKQAIENRKEWTCRRTTHKHKQEIFSYYNHQCQECKYEDNLEIHHISYDLIKCQGSHDENLWLRLNKDKILLLCRNCHRAIHKIDLLK